MNTASRYRLLLVLLAIPLVVMFNCAKNDSTTEPPPGPGLVAPTNLRAYSAGTTSVGLLWSLSTSESDASFSSYSLVVTGPGGGTVTTQSISKGNPQTVVTGLTEGVIYTFILRSVATNSAVSSDSASIQWSPAKRLITDSTNGPPIQVYEFASSAGASGLQFYSMTAGSALTQSLVPANPDRILSDVYLATNSNGISLNNLSSTTLVNPKNTVFSTVMRDAQDLDDPQLAPPAVSTYTLLTVDIPMATASQAKILYAKSVTDNRYVRILLKKNPATNLLYSGTSPNRYITVQLSYQDTTGNMYARPLSWPSPRTTREE